MNKLHFASLVEALNYFERDGGFVNFNIKRRQLEHPETKKLYNVAALRFLHSFKFEENSDADDVSILHAVEAADGTKGIFIGASGIYSELDFTKIK